MGRREAFDRKLEALAALRAMNAAGAEAPLRKALADTNGLYVSKAAAIAADAGAAALIPELVRAFQRFVDHAPDPGKADPQCWAKNALVRALHELGHRQPDVYLRGMRCVQLEAGFGGRFDSAGPLRGVCALALADADHPPRLILTALTDLLVDPEKAARLDAVRAVARMAQPESALVLRLKTLWGDAHPDVMRECLLSLMTLAPAESTALVARYLEVDANGDDLLCADAAEALASARHPEALEALLAFLGRAEVPVATRRTVLLTLAASTLPAAGEYLAGVIEKEPAGVAEAAITALGASRFREEMRARVVAALERRGEATLRRAFAQAFAPR